MISFNSGFCKTMNKMFVSLTLLNGSGKATCFSCKNRHTGTCQYEYWRFDKFEGTKFKLLILEKERIYET